MWQTTLLTLLWGTLGSSQSYKQRILQQCCIPKNNYKQDCVAVFARIQACSNISALFHFLYFMDQLRRVQ